jgi:class 3 adenylate cyclase
MTEIEKLEQGIAALEAQRSLLGNAVVDAMLAPIKEKLEALRFESKTTLIADQRKQVTVLFADLSGFTALSDKMDAEDVLDKMNLLWEKLDQVIIRHGGEIDKHIGDGVMALFGAKVSHEDDPERAVRAALEMQREIRSFGKDHPDLQLQMRIGLNTGPVLLGEVGSQREYTAMGDTVNLASRRKSRASGKRIDCP